MTQNHHSISDAVSGEQQSAKKTTTTTTNQLKALNSRGGLPQPHPHSLSWPSSSAGPLPKRSW